MRVDHAAPTLRSRARTRPRLPDRAGREEAHAARHPNDRSGRQTRFGTAPSPPATAHAASVGSSTRGKRGAAGSRSRRGACDGRRLRPSRAPAPARQRRESPRRRVGKIRGEGYRHRAEPVDEVVEDTVQGLRVRLLLGEPPRRRDLGGVGSGLTTPDRSSAPVKSKASRRAATSSRSGARIAATSESSGARPRRPLDAQPSPSHARAGCRGRISRARARWNTKPIDRGDTVLPERHRPRAPEAHGVGAVDVDQVEGVDDVAQRLGDLSMVQQQVAVDEQLARNVVTRLRAAGQASTRGGSGGCPLRAGDGRPARIAGSSPLPATRTSKAPQIGLTARPPTHVRDTGRGPTGSGSPG